MKSTLVVIGSAAFLFALPIPAQESPAPTPRPILKSAPVNSGLSGAAAGRKLNRSVRFNDVAQGDPVVPPAGPTGSDRAMADLMTQQDRATRQAQGQMDLMVKEGRKLDRPGVKESCKDTARNEWDTAAEACRKTPGCVPTARGEGDLEARKPVK